ncbi:PEP-CTERM sorting domain-containing protein [Sedimentisphaera salicampi]|uniref:PEP-CTERM protein-sorting domain-containing protein n=1 Tax=Sedimentisphaera salicampi TaxID=1941349 RepID=A0A1W6LPJ4_9BACT|nr:PEP-CTERM sorting domain-containing protein [Sedimentisphaera salicampi]ARN57700.1 hypothetical protein STSP1_02121 [Sedimentisphaera salicampi]
MAYVNQNSQNFPAGGSNVYLNLTATNNDPGAIYNSATFDKGIFGDLAQQLCELGCNSGKTVEDIVNELQTSIMNPPTGEVYNGWNAAKDSQGGLSLNHNAGWAGFDYDEWTSDSATNDLALTVSVPTSLLETDGIEGYDPETDARIVLGDTAVQNAFVGQEGGTFGRDFYSPMHQYEVVPEPMTALMFGVGALGVMAKRAGNKVRAYFS